MKQEDTKNSQPGAALQRRLSGYSILFAAGACAVASAPNAEASVVSSGPLNISVPVSVSGIYIDLADFTTYTSLSAAQTAEGTAAPILNIWGTSNTFSYLYPSASTVNRFVGTGTSPSELAAGATIDSTSTYTTSRASGALTPNPWTAGTTGYLGFRFTNGATTEYGWAQITAQAPPTAANPTKILGLAYENTGAGILAGQTSAVPEPGTVGALAFGAVGAGVMAWRRRKAA